MKIFIVDDESSARLIARASIEEDGVIVREFENAAAMLDELQRDSPDLILLDIEMPGSNGIEACRALRAAGNTSVQVVFVSAHNDLETRLVSYDAGGNDFIVKPYRPEELARKVAVARQSAASHRGLVQQASEAQRTAFTAMSAMAEMGILLESIRAFFGCDTPEALAARLLEGVARFDLDGLVQVRGIDGALCHSSKGPCSPLECSILEHASGMERLFQFRDRLVVNYPGITLVVKPLPLDDAERLGRLRDDLTTLAETADYRLTSLEATRWRQLQASNIGCLVQSLSATLAAADRSRSAQRLRMNETLGRLNADFGHAVVRLGLADSQESALKSILDAGQSHLLALGDEDSDINDSVRAAIAQLNALAAVPGQALEPGQRAERPLTASAKSARPLKLIGKGS